jgi:protein TonB
MSAILEAEQTTLVGTAMTLVRQFALRQIDRRLLSEPALISAFWQELGEPAQRPNLTVIYCTVRWAGRIYGLLEFAAGQTLEELVQQSDPTSCEREIPIFCRILDAFEGSKRVLNGEQISPPDLELLDFGVGRATADLTSRLHGAVLIGPDGFWNDSVFGEYGASRSQVFAALMELCATIPGNLPRIETYGPANLGVVSACSLAARYQRSEPAPKVEAAPVPKRRSLVGKVVPYLIALVTMALVLLMFYSVGGYLAKRTAPSEAGKLILPPMPVEPPEAPAEAVSNKPKIPAVTAAHPRPTAERPPVNRASVDHPKVPERNNKRVAKQVVPSIVVTSGAKPILQTDLQYPAEAQKENVTGLVQMQFTIAEDGSVQSPRVVSGDPLLRAGLTEEVSHWVYQPLRVNGKPVPMTTEMKIRFNLN